MAYTLSVIISEETRDRLQATAGKFRTMSNLANEYIIRGLDAAEAAEPSGMPWHAPQGYTQGI